MTPTRLLGSAMFCRWIDVFAYLRLYLQIHSMICMPDKLFIMVVLFKIFANEGHSFEEYPAMVAYATKKTEIAPLVKCAQSTGYRATPRSGGHQYVKA